MRGPDPRIHLVRRNVFSKRWIAGSSPAMTRGLVDGRRENGGSVSNHHLHSADAVLYSGNPANCRGLGTDMLQGQRVLLIIAGGIAAYKSLDLIRRLRDRGASVRVIMTAAAKQFVTPLAASATK